MHPMNGLNPPSPRILFIFLEFPNWRLGRSLAYPVQMGLEHALRHSGADVFSVPSTFGMDNNSGGNWLSRLQEMVGDRKFDQVWIEVVHADFDETFLSWLASLAPVRLAMVMESLQYEPYVYELEPKLRERKDRVLRRLAYMTHVLVADELDATDLNQDGAIKALWWPQTVPHACIQSAPPSSNEYAVFYGALYGKRQSWLKHPALAGLLVQPGPSLEYRTRYPELFDRLQQLTTRALEEGLPASEQILQRYLDVLRNVRENIFALWLRSLQQGRAVVNLPSYFQGFPGRIYESMGAGMPVISCAVPGRPRTNALFTDEQDILLYDPNSPEHLAHQIRRIQSDKSLAARLAGNASLKIRSLHTTEHRVSQIMCWVETGAEPDFSRSGSA